MNKNCRVYCCSLVVLVLAMPVVQAHGGNEATVSNPMVLFISIISSVFAWVAGSESVSYTHLTLPTNREV